MPKARFDEVNEAFQSTQPMRAATKEAVEAVTFDTISIHAAHAGSDSKSKNLQAKRKPFQSTLPMRAATFGLRL